MGVDNMNLADDIFELVAAGDPDIQPNYNKAYIGLKRSGKSDNFITLRPRKSGHVILSVTLENDGVVTSLLNEQGFDQMPYDSRYGYYRLRLKSVDLTERKNELQGLITKAQVSR